MTATIYNQTNKEVTGYSLMESSPKFALVDQAIKRASTRIVVDNETGKIVHNGSHLTNEEAKKLMNKANCQFYTGN